MFWAALLLLQNPTQEQVDGWVKDLGSDAVEVRDAAEKKLIEAGEKVLPLIAKHEKADDAEVRARLASVRKAVECFRMEAIFAVAEEALKEGSDPAVWKPKLEALVRKYREFVGDHLPEPASKPIEKAMGNAFDVKGKATVAMDGMGKTMDRVLLVCGSAAYERIDDSVVICLGDATATKIEDSLVIAKGRVGLLEEAKRSLIYAGKDFVPPRVERCAVWAVAGVAGSSSKGTVWINTKNVKLFAGGEDDRSVEIPRLVEK